MAFYIMLLFIMLPRMTASSNNRAFTWIELLVVIVILSYGSSGFLFLMISRANSMDYKANCINN